MVAPLLRVAVKPPSRAGWPEPRQHSRWRELGYSRAPNADLAQAQHDDLCEQLERAGAEVVVLPAVEGQSLDSVYVHDPSLITDRGAVCLRMGKPQREAEPGHHAECLAALDIPVAARIQAPGTVEGGDVVWLDSHTLLVGRGYRTNAAGIAQLRDVVAQMGVTVIEAPLPHGRGPDVCLHLMSILSLLDERRALVDLSWLAVPTVEELTRRGYALIEIDARERDALACNVLALGEGRLLALAGNPGTHRRLIDAGFDVRTFVGTEIAVNGAGGPTCLTRPLWRDAS